MTTKCPRCGFDIPDDDRFYYAVKRVAGTNPTPGSQVRHCSRCHEPCWIDGRIIKFVDNFPGNLQIVCTVCLLSEQR